GGETLERRQIRMLQQVSRALKTASEGQIDLSVEFLQQTIIAQVEIARQQLAAQRAARSSQPTALAGLEELSGKPESELISGAVKPLLIYQGIVKKATTLPPNVPSAREVTALEAPIRQGDYEGALGRLLAFIGAIEEATSGGDLPTDMVTLAGTLMRVLRQGVANLQELVNRSPLRKTIESVSRLFLESHIPQIGYFEVQAPTPRTTLVVAGAPGPSGLAHALSHELDKAGIGIESSLGEDRPGGQELGFITVTVGVSLADLEAKGVLQNIRRRLGIGGWRGRLHGFLTETKQRSDEQARRIESLYEQYVQTPGFIEDPEVWTDPDPRYAGLSLVGALFPYREPATAESRLKEEAQRGFESSTGIHVTETFATQFRHADPPHPGSDVVTSLIWISFRTDDLSKAKAGPVEALRQSVASHVGEAPKAIPTGPGNSQLAGLEEPPEFRSQGAGFVVTQPGVIRGSAVNPSIHLTNGAHLAAEGGDSLIRLAKGVRIEPGAIVVAPQGATVDIGPDTVVTPTTQVWGNLTVGAKVQLAGTFTGNSLIGDGTIYARGSTTVTHDSVLLPATFGGKVLTVNVNLAKAITNSVVWGSPIYQGGFLLNSILYLGSIGNDAALSRSALYGASPDNRTAAAHFNELISLYAVPLSELWAMSEPILRDKSISAIRLRPATSIQETTGPKGLRWSGAGRRLESSRSSLRRLR
ncbi:MAG: hypothetical protein HYZ90_01315, partial [Candidatus Omnitrophica bacterium]|nr:hypothetical protein [Candidatus Omnitrophota bacterium]